jgi:hypothetical protein
MEESHGVSRKQNAPTASGWRVDENEFGHDQSSNTRNRLPNPKVDTTSTMLISPLLKPVKVSVSM